MSSLPRRARRIPALLPGLIVLLLAIGLGSEAWARRRDRIWLARVGDP